MNMLEGWQDSDFIWHRHSFMLLLTNVQALSRSSSSPIEAMSWLVAATADSRTSTRLDSVFPLVVRIPYRENTNWRVSVIEKYRVTSRGVPITRIRTPVGVIASSSRFWTGGVYSRAPLRSGLDNKHLLLRLIEFRQGTPRCAYSVPRTATTPSSPKSTRWNSRYNHCEWRRVGSLGPHLVVVVLPTP